MDVIVGKRSDGAELHITGYLDSGFAKGYMVLDEAIMPINFPLYSLISAGIADWTLDEAALKRVPLVKEEKPKEKSLDEKDALTKEDESGFYKRVVVKDEK